jgi:hypothetical protein
VGEKCKPIIICDGNEIQQFRTYFGFRKTCPSKVVRNIGLPARLMAGWPAVLLARRLSGGLEGLTVIDSLSTYLWTCPPFFLSAVFLVRRLCGAVAEWRMSPSSC